MATNHGTRAMRSLPLGALVAGLLIAPTASGQVSASGLATGADAGDGGSAWWDRSGQPPRELREGSPAQAGLVAGHLEAVDQALRAGIAADPPVFPGAVALVARDGVVAEHVAHGDAVRYLDDGPTEVPDADRVPMRPDTVFDLASLTKLFTTVAVLQLVEDGELDLDAPVASTIPEFAAGGKDDVTTRHLLSHTAGLPAWLPLWSAYDSREERLAAVYDVEPMADPGARHVYSDLGLIVLGEMVARTAGRGLDEVVAERITRPLGMDDTGFDPDDDLADRIAATEYQPFAGRGMVHGEVHDENAWSLGGVAGHAGMFSTAPDLAVFAQMLLNGGRYGTARILEPDTVAEMMRSQTAHLPGADRGLGPELAQRWYMDALTTPVTAGHTGFTGTSLVLDPTTDSFAVLLTNRVHPSREGPSLNPSRAAVSRALARAVPVAPATGTEAWFSGIGDDLDQRLEVDLDLPEGDTRLSLALWHDLGPADALSIEVSTDGGDRWQPLPGELTAPRAEPRTTDGTVTGWGERRWWEATFDLDHVDRGPATLRLRYRSEDAQAGRGVYVDAVRVTGPRGPVFDDQLPTDHARWRADGWERSSD